MNKWYMKWDANEMKKKKKKDKKKKQPTNEMKGKKRVKNLKMQQEPL